MKINDLIIDLNQTQYSDKATGLFNIAEIHKTIVYNLSQIEITGIGNSPMALSLLNETDNLVKDYRNLMINIENEIERYFYRVNLFPDQTNNDEYNILTNNLCTTKILYSYYFMLNQHCKDLNFTLKKSPKHLQW